MPFSPASTHLAHCQAFAHRLHQLLKANRSKMGAMAFQEAFARAGGYADAHALRAAIKKRRPVDPLHAHLPGVGPSALDRWARSAWKHHRELLRQESEWLLSDTQELLAKTWGHENWEAVEESARAEEWPWLFSKSRPWDVDYWGELFGDLGIDENSQRVGLPWSALSSHARVQVSNPTHRHRLAASWAMTAHAHKEGVLVLDCSQGHEVARELVASDPTVVTFDATQGLPLDEALGRLGKVALVESTVTMLCQIAPALPPSEKGHMISWIARVVSLWQDVLKAQSLETLPFSYWLSFLGNSQISPGWRERLEKTKALIVSAGTQADQVYAALTGGQGLAVFRLPFDERKQHRHGIALAPVLLWMHRTLLTERQEIQPGMTVITDMALNGLLPGTAVFPAQARSLGRALCFFGEDFGPQATEAEAYAVLANLNVRLNYPSSVSPEEGTVTFGQRKCHFRRAVTP